MKKKDVHYLHWREVDRSLLRLAHSFHELSSLARSIVFRIPGEVHMVSSSLYIGPTGDINGDRIGLQLAVEALAARGLQVFSLMPFVENLNRLHRDWAMVHPRGAFCTPILTVFHRAILGTGKVAEMHYVFGWIAAGDHDWEYRLCRQLRVRRRPLPPEIEEEVFRATGKNRYLRYRDADKSVVCYR